MADAAHNQHLATISITAIAIGVASLVVLALGGWFLIEWLTYLVFRGNVPPSQLLSRSAAHLQRSTNTSAQLWSCPPRHRTGYMKPPSYAPSLSTASATHIAAATAVQESSRANSQPHALFLDGWPQSATAPFIKYTAGSNPTSTSTMANLINPEPRAPHLQLEYMPVRVHSEPPRGPTATDQEMGHDYRWTSRWSNLNTLQREYRLMTDEPVKHLSLQFSPNGRILAASHTNNLSVLFRVEVFECFGAGWGLG